MNKSWEITMGFYPGCLIGIRTYEEKEFNEHVLYLPFCVDISLKIDK
jgi:hypothetical protein|tara:strand:- start:396 stop:536 length:141 start_codon:yes stop_codon:yes gene_type:complete